MTNYANVLIKKYPNTVWTINADDYDQLVWLSDTPKPSKAELDALWPEVKAEMEAEQQARVSARESALGKLSALGLSEAEIKALLG